MNFFAALIKRWRVPKIARRLGAIVHEERDAQVLFSQRFVAEKERLVGDWIAIALTNRMPDWELLRQKHEVNELVLRRLFKLVHFDARCFHMTLQKRFSIAILTLDYAGSVEYLLDFEHDVPKEELVSNAIDLALGKLQNLPRK